MKTIGKLFLAAAVAFGLMACNKEEVPEVVQGPEATVSVKVVPAGLTPTTRLAGDLSGNGIAAPGLVTESDIKNVEVWLFAGETPNGYKKGADGSMEVTGIETTAGNRTMVVAANANIGEVTNKADLLAKIADLSQDISKGLVMTAEPVDLKIVKGHNQYGYAKAPDIHNLSEKKLQITRINARIALVNLEYKFENKPYDKFELTEVAMFNARKQSKLFGSSLVKGDAEYLFGSPYPTPEGSYVGYDNPSLAVSSLAQTFKKQDGLLLPKLIDPKNAHYFYALENDKTNGTFIILKGYLKKGDVVVKAEGLFTDENGFTYYPIWVNIEKDGYTYTDGHTPDGTIKRNTQYNISVKITKAGNPSVDDPQDAKLDVQVEVTPWIVVGQNVEWK